MNKETLLSELSSNTLIMLKPSPVQGIGVFAIAPINRGSRNIFSTDTSKWIEISKKEIESLPPHAKRLVKNFCLYDQHYYFVPEYGFKMVDLVIFLNHSDYPNIISINDGEDFEAIKNIRAGEELFIDYGKIV